MPCGHPNTRGGSRTGWKRVRTSNQRQGEGGYAILSVSQLLCHYTTRRDCLNSRNSLKAAFVASYSNGNKPSSWGWWDYRRVSEQFLAHGVVRRSSEARRETPHRSGTECPAAAPPAPAWRTASRSARSLPPHAYASRREELLGCRRYPHFLSSIRKSSRLCVPKPHKTLGHSLKGART